MSWRNSTNKTIGFTPLGVSQLTKSSNLCTKAPIDRFYEELQQLLLLGQSHRLSNFSNLGPLVLVGMVSLVENYLRQVLGKVLTICPDARAKAAEQKVNLGSALWHEADVVSRGAFEHMSLASQKNVEEALQKFLDYPLKTSSPTKQILPQYNNLCELRHCIVHGNRTITGKNAIKLGLPSPARHNCLLVEVQFAELQAAAEIALALVTAFNNEIFELLVDRFATSWPSKPHWQPNERYKVFKTLWSVFFSALDEQRGDIPNSLTVRKCYNAVVKDYSL